MEYDLGNVKFSDGADTIYPLSQDTTDRDLINSTNLALMEPMLVSWPGGWTGTEQFDLNLVSDAIQFAINSLQLSSGLITTTQVVSPPPAPSAQFDLPTDCINLRSLYWITPEGQEYPLTRQDQYLSGMLPKSGLPSAYSVVSVAPRRVQLTIIPTDTGTIRVIYAPGNLVLQPTLAATVLNIPTNFSWAVKWYALFTLLNAEGESRDKFRADYCMMRLKDSQVVAKVFPSILRAYVNEVEVPVITPWDKNAISPNWRNQQEQPNQVILHSANLISLSPVPKATVSNPEGQYSISFDCSANAPIPENEAAYLDLSSELVQPLLDYAHHLACFKLGGTEFADTIESYKRFLQAAMQQNLKLRAESNNFQLLKEKTEWAKKRKPIMEEEPA
jgi:hypothetical protein